MSSRENAGASILHPKAAERILIPHQVQVKEEEEDIVQSTDEEDNYSSDNEEITDEQLPQPQQQVSFDFWVERK